MNAQPGIREEDLHAFIDGELEETVRARVEAIIEADPQLRERVAQYRADKARLGSIYGGGMSDPLPREWLAQIEAATARRPWRAQYWGVAALAASFVLTLTGIVAWREFAAPPVHNDIVAEALAARAREVPPQEVIASASRPVLAREARVMTRDLDTRVKPPDLSRMGYRLTGIDVYSAPARAFELRYIAPDGGTFTLYLRRSAGAPRFDQFEEKGLRVCIWQDDVIGMVMAGKISVAEMQRLAALAYTELET